MVRQIVRRGAIAGLTLLGIEAAYAVLRPAPPLDHFDPSGEFGDPSNPTLRVAVLGDSSVTAPGVGGADEIWVSLVCERLAENWHVVLQSFAVGGSMAHNVIADQAEEAIAFQPDVFFVSVGANDVIKGVPTRTFETNLDRLIAMLADTGATVVQSGVGIMGTIPRLYPPLSHLISRRARSFDRIHWKVAEQHSTAVVDQWSDDARVWNSDRSLWAEDSFHVSAAGHARWADTAWRTIGPLLERVNEPG
jgi:lysophospholipase L1-like esterase